MVETLSSANESFLPPFTNTSLDYKLSCLMVSPGSFIFLAFYISNIVFFVPVCLIILHHAFQQRGSTATWSNTDCLTYHLVTMELIGVVGYLLLCCSFYQPNQALSNAGTYLSSFLWNGEVYFHALLCLDRYMAVVHPIKYRSINTARKLRIRNICVACVWLVCSAEFGFLIFKGKLILNICLLVIVLLVVSLCSLAILSAFIHPGSGDHVGTRVFIDHSKRKAFYIVGSILVALVARFSWSFYWIVLLFSDEKINCVMASACVWLNLPSSLVLPLLFLHKIRKKLFLCRRKQ